MNASMMYQAQIKMIRDALKDRDNLPTWAYEKLMDILQQADDKALKLIAGADIRFASPLAHVEMIRREEKRHGENRLRRAAYQ